MGVFLRGLCRAWRDHCQPARRVSPGPCRGRAAEGGGTPVAAVRGRGLLERTCVLHKGSGLPIQLKSLFWHDKIETVPDLIHHARLERGPLPPMLQ